MSENRLAKRPRRKRADRPMAWVAPRGSCCAAPVMGRTVRAGPKRPLCRRHRRRSTACPRIARTPFAFKGGPRDGDAVMGGRIYIGNQRLDLRAGRFPDSRSAMTLRPCETTGIGLCRIKAPTVNAQPSLEFADGETFPAAQVSL